MRFSIRLLVLTGLVLLLGVVPCLRQAAGQTVNASLGGIVSDATGARVAGATVTLLNEASKDTRKSKTNGEGIYQFSAIPAGIYSVKIEHEGFEAYVESGIELHPNDARTLPVISLKVGSVSASVTVTAQNEVIDTSERSSLITASDIKKLSTVGRDASELLKTQPGFAILQNGLNNGLGSDPAVVGSGGSGLANYVGNGAPGNGASVISDGANVTDPGNESGQTQTVNMDMVSEVKIETSNFGADTAKGPTVITVVGKSGSSDFHGTVYGFARTSQMNSEDWFLKNQQLPQIPDRYIYPGFNVQGPVKIPRTKFNDNKKLVFSAGAEDYVQRDVYSYGSALTSFINALVPTDQSTNADGEPGMRQGNFTQAELANYIGHSVAEIEDQTQGKGCNASGDLANYYHICAQPATSDGVISSGVFANGAKSFDPGAAALLAAEFPLPTGPTVNGYNWRHLNLQNPDVFQIRGRVDLAINDSNKIYGVYNTESGRTTGIPEQIYYSPSAGSTALMGGLDTPGKIISTQTSNTASLNYTTVLSARSTNEAFAAISYVANYYVSGDQNALLASTYNYPYSGIFPTASKEFPQLSDYGNHGLPLAITPDFSNGRYISKKFIPSGGDNFNFLVKSHTLKLGAYIERDTANQTDLSPITNGQITNYYVPDASFTDAAGSHNTTSDLTCGFGGCGANYLADFLLGDVDQFFQQNFNPQTNIYYWTISGFIQDSWKATKRLTVDAGLRVDHLGAWTDSHGLGIAVFEPALYATDPHTRVTSPTKLPGVRWHANMPSLPMSGDKTRLAFVSPRVGLAYDLFGTGKTVFRGGWGMYRSHDSWNDFSPSAATAQGLLIESVGGAGTSLAATASQYASANAGFICNASGTSS
ncbi:MAG: carboxypeptidase-like regulatory domain-containing protein, partial [Terracidiphilus sp.]